MARTELKVVEDRDIGGESDESLSRVSNLSAGQDYLEEEVVYADGAKLPDVIDELKYAGLDHI